MANPRNDAVYVTTGNPETVDDAPDKVFAPGQVGKYWTGKQPSGQGTKGALEYREKTYQYVQLDSASDASYDGATAWWISRQRGRVTLDVDAAESRNAVAGAFQGVVTPGNYGFVQKRGPGNVKIVDSEALAAQAAGLAVIPSETVGKAETDAAGTAPTYALMGFTTGSGDAAAALAVVELQIPEVPVG